MTEAPKTTIRTWAEAEAHQRGCTRSVPCLHDCACALAAIAQAGGGYSIALRGEWFEIEKKAAMPNEPADLKTTDITAPRGVCGVCDWYRHPTARRPERVGHGYCLNPHNDSIGHQGERLCAVPPVGGSCVRWEPAK